MPTGFGIVVGHYRAPTLSRCVWAINRFPFQEWLIGSPAERRLVWSTYWVDGHFATSLFKVKLLQVAAAVQGHEGQAVLALSTEVVGTPDEARYRLAQALSNQNQLPARLEQANRRAPAGGTP